MLFGPMATGALEVLFEETFPSVPYPVVSHQTVRGQKLLLFASMP